MGEVKLVVVAAEADGESVKRRVREPDARGSLGADALDCGEARRSATVLEKAKKQLNRSRDGVIGLLVPHGDPLAALLAHRGQVAILFKVNVEAGGSARLSGCRPRRKRLTNLGEMCTVEEEQVSFGGRGRTVRRRADSPTKSPSLGLDKHGETPLSLTKYVALTVCVSEGLLAAVSMLVFSGSSAVRVGIHVVEVAAPVPGSLASLLMTVGTAPPVRVRLAAPVASPMAPVPVSVALAS